MARDWERLAGEKGRAVPSGRFKRMFKMGSLGVSVSASAVARKVTGTLLPRNAERKEEADGKWRTRHAERVIEVLGELKGASMKIGQMLSTDPDLVPPEFTDALTRLQRDAPPMTYGAVRQVIEEALAQPIEDAFRFFDPEPIGSASIGQVHRGTLKDGTDVAVKVQYPGVVDSLESDLKNLGSLLTIGRAFINKKRLEAYLAECRNAVLEEADYIREAIKLDEFHDLLQARDGVRAPRPVMELTRLNVLTMEYVEGAKLDEALAAMEDGPLRQDIIERWVTLYVWMFHHVGRLHADPHPGNFLLDADHQLVMLDYGCVKECDMRFADGVLDIMNAVWHGDDRAALALYDELGFGGDDVGRLKDFDVDLLREYHEIILEPFLYDEAFDFGAWAMHAAAQKFIMRHPSMVKVVPPAEALLPARVMGGIKGMLTKLDAKMNVHQMAVRTARERGRLTGDPIGRTRA